MAWVKVSGLAFCFVVSWTDQASFCKEGDRVSDAIIIIWNTSYSFYLFI